MEICSFVPLLSQDNFSQWSRSLTERTFFCSVFVSELHSALLRKSPLVLYSGFTPGGGSGDQSYGVLGMDSCMQGGDAN